MSKRNKIATKFLQILPGFLVWFFLLSPIVFGVFYPNAVIFILTFLTFYWAYRVLLGVIGIIWGFYKFKKETQIDWLQKLNELDYKKLQHKETLPESKEAIKHFILIPIYNEPIEVLKDNFRSVYTNSISNSKKLVVYAIEEKYATRVIEDLDKIYKEIDTKGEIEILKYIHPAGIPGEMIGVAGANRNFAARNAVEDLKKRKKEIRNYIFSTFDSDAVVHKDYFAKIEYLYLTNPDRLNKFFETAVHIFDNNTWNVPILNRVAADSVSISILSSWSTVGWPISTTHIDTFSAYSAALQTLIDADFWDVSIGIDDTAFYWRAYKARDGNFSGVPFFLPIHLDCAEGKDFFHAHKSLYLQQLRWGWGVILFPFAIISLITAKQAHPFEKMAHFWNEFEMKVIFRVFAFLLTFGFTLLSLVNKDITQANYAYAIPKINSLLMTTVLLGVLPSTIIVSYLKKPMPKNWNIIKKMVIKLLDGFGVFINLLTFGFIPWIEAETKLMLGKKYKSLYVSPKFR